MMKLNPIQEEAVRTIEGPLLIFAGAGSGKTRVITHRIAHMIESAKIPAHKIVALSFTNKSAKEMTERLRKMIHRDKLKGIVLSTFHALGLKILKEHIGLLGYKQPFLLLNSNDQEALVGNLLKNKKIDPKKVPPKEIIRRISLGKNKGVDYVDYLSTSSNEFDEIASAMFSEYKDHLHSTNSLDFDDLILLPSRLFQEHKEVASIYHKKYNYHMVDEFQDTNQLQYDFLAGFMGNQKNLCVVGDDDQSIYAFRGSNVELILNFEKDFPDAKVVRLLENYRSASNIIQAANRLIQKNSQRKEKQLYSRIQSEEKVEVWQSQDEREEASMVTSWIETQLIQNRTKGSDIAILFRTNFQSRPFEEELRLRNIPYKVIGGYNFFDRKEVRDLISYIRIVANSKDEYSLLRIINYPKRGIGAGSVSKIHEKSVETSRSLWDVLLDICESPDFLAEIKGKTRSEIYQFVELVETFRKKFATTQKLAPVLREMVAQIGFEREISIEETDEKVIKARLYNLSELVNMLAFFEEDQDREEKPTLFDFLARLALLMEDDLKDESQEDRRVQLLTIHQSKGLEFEKVFVVGLEEGILPNSRVIEEGEAVDEERRLMYVAMTRAKSKLFLTNAKTRKKYGETLDSTPSRFLTEIDGEDVQLHFRDEDTDNIPTVDFLKELEQLKSRIETQWQQK